MTGYECWVQGQAAAWRPGSSHVGIPIAGLYMKGGLVVSELSNIHFVTRAHVRKGSRVLCVALINWHVKAGRFLPQKSAEVRHGENVGVSFPLWEKSGDENAIWKGEGASKEDGVGRTTVRNAENRGTFSKKPKRRRNSIRKGYEGCR